VSFRDIRGRFGSYSEFSLRIKIAPKFVFVGMNRCSVPSGTETIPVMFGGKCTTRLKVESWICHEVTIRPRSVCRLADAQVMPLP